MVEKALNKFCWGFFFILLGFRIQGFDIFPDIVGYILFAMGFNALGTYSEHFEKAKVFNYIMIFLSIFSIYERPQQQGTAVIQANIPDWVTILVGIAGTVITLIVVFHIFAGIIEMATKQRKPEIVEQADKKWTQFIVIQVAILGLFVFMIVPAFAMIYMLCLVVVVIAYTLTLMAFMKKCGMELK
jgi:hypothetical protein